MNDLFLLPGSPLPALSGGDDAGISTRGTTTNLVDNTKYWVPGIWQGALLLISIGNQVYTTIVTTNTPQQLTFPAIPSGVQMSKNFYLLKRLPPSLTRPGINLTATQTLVSFSYMPTRNVFTPAAIPWLRPPLPKGGTHTGAPNPIVMTDAAATFVTSQLIGDTIYNLTDLSSGTIISNDGTSITVAALSGGVLNTWSPGDSYVLGAHLIHTSTGFPMPYIVSQGYTLSLVETFASFSQPSDIQFSFDTLPTASYGYLGAGIPLHLLPAIPVSSALLDPSGSSQHLLDVVVINYGAASLFGSIVVTGILEAVQ